MPDNANEMRWLRRDFQNPDVKFVVTPIGNHSMVRNTSFLEKQVWIDPEIDCISNWRWHVETQQKTNQYPRQLWHWMSRVSGVTPAASRWRGMLFWIVSVTIILILQLMIFHLVSNTMLFIKTEHYYGKVPILYDMIKYPLQILYSLVFVWTTKKCSKKMVDGSNSWQGPFF